MLKSPAPDMDEIREIADDIRRDDVRASEVIQRLRSLLKKSPFEVKPSTSTTLSGGRLLFFPVKFLRGRLM